MKILITGAAGFVGSHLARRLVDQGHNVCLLSSSPRTATRSDATWETLDLRDTAAVGALTKLMDDADHCCLLAAVKPAPGRNSDVLAQNEQIDRISSQAFSKSRCPSGIYVSGLSVFSHRRTEMVTEDTPPDPDTDYTRSKFLGEKIFQDASDRASKTWRILRINAPYGPAMVPHAVVRAFLTAAMAGQPLYLFGRGERRQHFTWAGDCADAMSLLFEREIGIYHFCGPESNSMLELAEACVETAGSKSRIVFKNEDPGLSCPVYGPDRLENEWPRTRRTSLLDGLKKMHHAMQSGLFPLKDLTA